MDWRIRLVPDEQIRFNLVLYSRADKPIRNIISGSGFIPFSSSPVLG